MKEPVETPFVSVIMPTFNVARFVESAVSSVLEQTFSNFELIVVDDGSTDATLERLSSFRDARLRVIKQDHKGSASARNRGLALSSAPFVAFLDGDDLWDPAKLMVHLRFLRENQETDLTFSHSLLIDEGGKLLGRRSVPIVGSLSFRELLLENFISNGSAVVLRREAVLKAGGFDASLRAVVDHDLWLRIARMRDRNVQCIPRPLTFYRIRDGQVTKDWRRMEEAWLAMMAKMRCLSPNEVEAVETLAKSRMYRYLSYLAYEGRNYLEARRLLNKAIRQGALEVFGDRRGIVLCIALGAQTILPSGWHRRLDAFLRRCRARQSNRQDKPPSGWNLPNIGAPNV